MEKTGETQTGIAQGNFGWEESFARRRGKLLGLAFKIARGAGRVVGCRLSVEEGEARGASATDNGPPTTDYSCEAVVGGALTKDAGRKRGVKSSCRLWSRLRKGEKTKGFEAGIPE